MNIKGELKMKYSRPEIKELEGVLTTKQAKENRIREYRKEASRLASMANKRLARLERNNLTDSPAYQGLLGDDGVVPHFGIRGKDYNQVQSEVARMNRFLNNTTSTVRGANKVLKDMAKNTGIKYKNLTELKTKAKQFFELASKVEQYLRTVDDMASAIGYQKIWEQVNQYVKEQETEFDGAEMNIDKAILDVTNAIKEYEEKIDIKDIEGRNFGWFQLDKN